MRNASSISKSLLLSIYVIVPIFVLQILSCSKNCEDCEQVTYFLFGIVNTTDQDVEFVFFKSQDSTIVSTMPGEVLETILVLDIGARGVLPTTPLNISDLPGRSPYDSVSIFAEGTRVIFFADECVGSDNNPLCVESYEQSQSISDSGRLLIKKFIYNYE